MRSDTGFVLFQLSWYEWLWPSSTLCRKDYLSESLSFYTLDIKSIISRNLNPIRVLIILSILSGQGEDSVPVSGHWPEVIPRQSTSRGGCHVSSVSMTTTSQRMQWEVRGWTANWRMREERFSWQGEIMLLLFMAIILVSGVLFGVGPRIENMTKVRCKKLYLVPLNGLILQGNLIYNEQLNQNKLMNDILPRVSLLLFFPKWCWSINDGWHLWYLFTIFAANTLLWPL